MKDRKKDKTLTKETLGKVANCQKKKKKNEKLLSKAKEKATWDEQKKMWIKCTIVITNAVAKKNDLYITVYRLNNNRWKRRRSMVVSRGTSHH